MVATMLQPEVQVNPGCLQCMTVHLLQLTCVTASKAAGEQEASTRPGSTYHMCWKESVPVGTHLTASGGLISEEAADLQHCQHVS